MHSVNYDLSAFAGYDCMVLITNHRVFNNRELAELDVPIIDTRNAFVDIQRDNIYKLGTGIRQQEVRLAVGV
ncbi:hypothetical protein D3C84_1143120 [compost metagenome]